MDRLFLTFCNKENLEKTLVLIYDTYELSKKKLYVLETNEENLLAITYNSISKSVERKIVDTLIVHRYKNTNTIYTINAVNIITKDIENKVMPFAEYKNSILCTSQNKIRILKTKLIEIVEV